jgi:glycosyltransferase involved in cell wall biosynthesis
MKISIVTPSYNQGEFLEETIDSVLSQGVGDVEYIIMDGGSTDNSVEIIKKYEKYLHYWQSKPDGGQTEAINQGFKHASGDILCYLNSDDVYFPGVFQKVVDSFSKNQSLELLYGDNAVLYPDGRIVGKPKIAYDYDICLNAFLMIQQPSSFWSSNLYRQLEGFNEEYQFCFDYDFYLRAGLHLKGGAHNSIIHVQDLWSMFRVHDSSKTISQKDEFSRETKILRSDHNFTFNPILRPFIKHYYLFKTLIKFYQQRGVIPLRSGSGY